MVNKKQPEVRISKYEGDWENFKLADIFNERSERSNEGELISVTINSGVVKATDLERKDNSSSDKSNYKIVRKGDIAYNSMRMWQGASGFSNYDGILSPAYTVITPRHEIDSKFISYMFKKHNMIQVFKRNSQGLTSDTWNLKFPALSTIKVTLPGFEEQQSISEILQRLDEATLIRQQELTTLKQTKQGFLQKMFPKEGEKVPEVRFPGFTDDWEQYNLGEVIEDVYNGQTPSRAKKVNWNGDINWLTSGELNRGVVTETIEKITPEGQKDALLKIVPIGTFVMAITGLEAAGTRGSCAKLAIDTTLNQSCMAVYPDTNLLDTKFLFQWYRKVGEEYGLRYTQGTKQQSYNAELIKILPIILPKVDEQKEIAAFLDNIDNTVLLHQRELELLQLTKKAFLQKLFV